MKPIRRYLRMIAEWTLCCVATACWATVAPDQSFAADPGPETNDVIAFDSCDYSAGNLHRADGGIGWNQAWRTSRVGTPQAAAAFTGRPEASAATTNHMILISGTGNRNNPLRREFAEPLSPAEIFVGFDFRYQPDVLSDPSVIDPEFCVLWLDRLEGGDRATHSSNVPNIGVHYADKGPQKGKNVFMVRVGPAQTAWSEVELRASRTYRIVARLSKSDGDASSAYDRFDLWIDPDVSAWNSPDATLHGVPSLSFVRWIGISTGAKTETSDQIQVGNLVVARTWESTLAGAVQRIAASERTGENEFVWDQPVDFRRDVYPLLKSRCFACHCGEQPDSGHRLDVHRELLGYSTGEVLAEPGRSHTSRLIEVVATESDDARMPPIGEQPLSAPQVAMLRAWIDQGMKWDDELLPPPRRRSDHWAFQSIQRPEARWMGQGDWEETPVDTFIARAHATAGLTPAPDADSLTLVRRLHLDLIGLPPTTEQVDEFLNDQSPSAYESLVERLLASPHYGERWGRYWLDLARWAESQGYQHDFVRPYAWRYRDYVIDSFNSDKPYDRFLTEQIAGDELRPYSDENVIATGFLGAARISGNQEDDEIQRNDVLVDIVNATSSVILGLTIECAQCHNHKFDPISQRDYYRLQAFFVNGQLGNLSLREQGIANPTDIERWIPQPAFDFYSKEVKSLIKKKLHMPTTEPYTWGYLSAQTGDPDIRRFTVVNRRPIPWQPERMRNTKAHLLIRGDPSHPGPQVRPGWPEVLGLTPSSLGATPRRTLARWMADPSNPLVARVWVNRLWQYHFGRGIVATESDFGVSGAAPTHPQLLDYLAMELISSGWSTKHIHRQIVLSRTYRQRRRHDAANARIDPENRLLWNWPRRRLEAESIRDSVLVATGELDPTLGGVSVPPEREEQHLRRTIYLFQQRSSMPSVMEVFDAPIGIASCARRPISTVPLQPLFMLNSEFMSNRAAALARQVAKTAGTNAQRQIDIAFQRTLSRKPDRDERVMASRILGAEPDDELAPVAPERLMHLCHALLNLNEFVYIP